MNNETAKRHAIAQRIAAAYGAHPNARAAVLLGSTARDQCDRYSDIDMTIFYDVMPADEALARAQETLGGTGLKPLGERQADGFAETFMLDGVDCQVGHGTLAFMDAIFDGLLETSETDHDPHVIAGGILESVALLGEPVIARWKERLAVYPDALALAMVRAHLRFRPRWFFDERVAGRDTLIIFNKLLGDAVRNILGVLLGLNRIYPEHDFKRLGGLLARLPIAPHDIDARIRRILRGDYNESTAELETLVNELFELVEQHMPEVDTTEARARFMEPDPVAG